MQKLFQPAFSHFTRNFTKATKITNCYSTSSKSIHTDVQYRFLTSKNKSNAFKYAFAAVATFLALSASSSSSDSYAYDNKTTLQDQVKALKKMNCDPKAITTYLLQGLAAFEVFGLTSMLFDVGILNDLSGEDAFIYHSQITVVTPETFLSREPVMAFDKEMLEEVKQGLIPVSARVDIRNDILNRILSLRVYMEYDPQAVEQISPDTNFNAELIQAMDELEDVGSKLISLTDKDKDEAFNIFFRKFHIYKDYVKPRLVLMYLGEIEGGKLKSGHVKEVLYDSKSSPPIYGFDTLQLYYDPNSREYVTNYNKSDVAKRFKLK